MTTQEIKLPITAAVPFQAYQIRGFEAAILLAHDESTEKFLFNSCINCYLREKESGNPLFDYTCNYTSWFAGQDVFCFQTIPIDVKETTKESLTVRVREYLRHGIYVSGSFNEKYIPHKNAYGRRDFKHSFLLYGYDQAEQIFYAIGYTDNAKFELYQIAYSDFANGILNVEKPALLLRYFRPDTKLELNLQRIYEELGDYLHSDYTVNHGTGKNRNDLYGIRAHHAFRSYIARYGQSGKFLDVRHSRFFYENKDFMQKRLSYLHQKGYISDYSEQYAIVAQKSKTIHLLFLKYNMTLCTNSLKAIDRLLEEVNQLDEEILFSVYEELTAWFKQKKQEVYL